MLADDLKIDELIQFKPGLVGLKGRRLVIHDIHAFFQLRKDLRESLGQKHARRLIHRFGYAWGQADAAAMQRIFKWKDISEWVMAGPKMQDMQGVARTTVKQFDWDPDTKKCNIKIVWRGSHEAEDYVSEYGQADAPVCCMLTSYASGYLSYCLGENIYVVEQKCRGMGDRICTAEGRDVESWGPDGKQMMSYYKSKDIQNEIEKLTRNLRRKEREVARQRQHLSLVSPGETDNLVGISSRAFRKILDLAQRVAPFDTTVLLTGESGVGKEVLARYLVSKSPRKKKMFLAVNCGALPETLLESELFGHTKGAFTGATSARIGLFEQACGGTVFLDEIGDVSPALQVKLLRVLQNREIIRVGESKPRPIDVRLLAATNKNLTEEVEAGRVREDLYYRLNVFEIKVPSLRERPEDILPLARHFLMRCSFTLKRKGLIFSPATLNTLANYDWPGNVRELENAIEHAVVMTVDETIMPDHLPSAVFARQLSVGTDGNDMRSLAIVEMEHIQRVMDACDGNKTQAAKTLGISGATLWRKLKDS